MSSADPPPGLFRLHHTLTGERLVPVTVPAEATHMSIATVQRLGDEAGRTIAAHREQAQRLSRRVRELEALVADLTDRAARAEERAAQASADAAARDTSIRKLMAKNGTLIVEKRRLRDALIGKQPLPHVAYRIEMDREGTVRESVPVTLECFPDRQHTAQVLAEARRLAERHGGQLRQVRLDAAAWRAVIQRVIDA